MGAHLVVTYLMKFIDGTGSSNCSTRDRLIVSIC